MKMIPVIAVVGPTASGKTALAAELAQRFGAEVVSCDSMQIYKGMDIATAKPTEAEMLGIPHHLISEIDRDSDFSAAMYKELAQSRIKDIYSRGKNIVLAGGTGLYAKVLLENPEFVDAPKDIELRRSLEARADRLGTQVLLDELKEIDGQAAEKLHPNDRTRIIRALEVYYSSGKTISQQVSESHRVPSPYKACMIGLDFRDRQKLYDRINRRVDLMIKNGLLDETRRYISENHRSTANQAIGCKEMAEYLNGNATLEQAAEKLKRETRRYAKRQLTWFRNQAEVNLLYVDDYGSRRELFEAACGIIEKSGILEGEFGE